MSIYPKFFRILKKSSSSTTYTSKKYGKFSNWNKQRIKMVRIHVYIANVRKDYLDKISAEIFKKHRGIGINKGATNTKW